MAKKRTTAKKTDDAGTARIHGSPFEPKQIDTAEDSPGDCKRCLRPVLSTPFFSMGEGVVFCCGDCLNDYERAAGRDVYRLPKGTTSRPAPKKRGNLTRAEAVFVPVACPACGSANREKFTGTARRVVTGGNCPLTGRRYNVVVFRWTKCKDCGQSIAAKSYEWDPSLE